MGNKRTICFDFDGVINSYKSGFTDIDDIPDEPVAGIDYVFRKLEKDGYDIKIHTTRACTYRGKVAVWEWLRKYGLNTFISDVTDSKPPAWVYVDDRAIQFDGNVASLYEKIVGFKCYLEK